MNQIEFMKSARALISEPENWTTGIFARDADGVDVSPMSKQATCFCALGAMWKIAEDNNEYDMKASLENRLFDFAILHKTSGISTFNDKMGHTEVLNMFDAVISVIEKESVAYGSECYREKVNFEYVQPVA